MNIEQLRNAIRGAFNKTYEHTVFDLPIEPKFEAIGLHHIEVDDAWWKRRGDTWDNLGFWRLYTLRDVEEVLMRMRPEDITGRVEESFLTFYLDKINSHDNHFGLKNREALKELGYINEFSEEDAFPGHHNDYPLLLEFCQKLISEKGYEPRLDAGELFDSYIGNKCKINYLIQCNKHAPISVGLFFSRGKNTFGVYAGTMCTYPNSTEISSADVAGERLETYPLEVLKDPEALERIAEHVAFNAPFTRRTPEAMKKKMPQRGMRP